MYRLVRISAAFLCALTAPAQSPLNPPPGNVSLLLFVLADCPISRRVSPEFLRICTEYASRGLSCTAVFVDPETTPDQARQYLKDFSLEQIPFVVDARHYLVKSAGATVTPEAAVFDSKAKLLYLGRIDDSHASWTQTRPATRRDLRSAVDAVLTGRPVPHPRTKAVGCYISVLPDDFNKD